MIVAVAAAQPTQYGNFPDIGPTVEPSRTAGTQFDGTDTYPGDINSGPTNTTYRMRSSGSPYGSNTSVLTPPAGTKILPYNGETIQLNGRIVVSASDITLAGFTLVNTLTTDDHGIDVEESSGTAIEDIVIRNLTAQCDGKHVLAIRGNVDGVQVFNVELIRNGEASASGDPSEFFTQNQGAEFPTNIWVSNVLLQSRSNGAGNGTNDALQLQDTGIIHIEHVEFGAAPGATNGFPVENWIDFKEETVTPTITVKRIKLPNADNDTWISRADYVAEECIMEADARVSAGVGANEASIDWLRFIWPDYTGSSSGEFLELVESTSSRLLMSYVRASGAGIGDNLRVQVGSTVLIEGNNFDNVDLSDAGTVTCQNNKITNGAGWGSCTGAQ